MADSPDKITNARIEALRQNIAGQPDFYRNSLEKMDSSRLDFIVRRTHQLFNGDVLTTQNVLRIIVELNEFDEQANFATEWNERLNLSETYKHLGGLTVGEQLDVIQTAELGETSSAA